MNRERNFEVVLDYEKKKEKNRKGLHLHCF